MPISTETLHEALTRDELVAAVDALRRNRLKGLYSKFKLEDFAWRKQFLIDRLIPAPRTIAGRNGSSDSAPPKSSAKLSQRSASVAPITGRTCELFHEFVGFLWQNAERLRGAYCPDEYAGVVSFPQPCVTARGPRR